MNKKLLAIITLILLFTSATAYAFFKQYPPYKFKDGSSKHLEAEPVVSHDKSEYKSKDGMVYARLKDANNTLDFLLKEDKTVLVFQKDREMSIPHAVYSVDLDKNGLKDFIVIYNYRGVGLEGYHDKVDIFLKRNDGKFQKISYDTMSAGLEDFIDLNKDGEFEIIITDVYSDKKHSYFTYNIYEINSYRLTNADSKFKGFPKFVWMTNKENDKSTTHLTKAEKAMHTNQKNSSIQYSEV
jgi:hypothetical protein